MRQLLQYIINLWIQTTGRSASTLEKPWLKDPMGEKATIGSQFYQEYADKMTLNVVNTKANGLMQNFMDAFSNNDALKSKIAPEIVDFYEHTAAYKLEVWSQWYAPIKYFAHTLIKLLSPQMDQLNIPLEPLETSRGMSNEVISL